MKKIVYISIALIAFACNKAEEPPIQEESIVPEFYTGLETIDPVIQKEYGVIQGINSPRDLDFKPDKNELWVMNMGSNGSDFVIIQNPGESSDNIIKRRDSHSSHFVPNGSALAFSNLNTFATTPEIKNTVQDTNATFMGPALWSGDLSVFANVNQSNWDPNKPLGSHLDMLHQSPFSMGIAHDIDNAFFVLDGWNGNLCHYEFVDDHGPGAEYHADGRVFRYTDVDFQRVPGIPSHIIKDPEHEILYWCNTAEGKIMKVDLATAKATTKLQSTNEQLSRYYAMTGATVTTFASGLEQPSGIDISGKRLFVSDYKTGLIHVYDLETETELAFVDTGDYGVTGIKVSANNRLWFVNNINNTLNQIIPQ